ncbi:MAG TPA: hypothetical protein VE971_03355 [Candidatus Eisenbacteria bacterium]|nr:hypothetical protein [Candidatus Eisenbacteria bacterium]
MRLEVCPSKVSLLNSPGPTTYPIASFTYLLLHKDLSINPNLDPTKAKALVDFISWAITDFISCACRLYIMDKSWRQT